jgi:hypothetical protein
MPIYISRGRFTLDAIKGMLAKPEDREEAVAKLLSARDLRGCSAIVHLVSDQIALEPDVRAKLPSAP